MDQDFAVRRDLSALVRISGISCQPPRVETAQRFPVRLTRSLSKSNIKAVPVTAGRTVKRAGRSTRASILALAASVLLLSRNDGQSQHFCLLFPDGSLATWQPNWQPPGRTSAHDPTSDPIQTQERSCYAAARGLARRTAAGCAFGLLTPWHSLLRDGGGFSGGGD